MASSLPLCWSPACSPDLMLECKHAQCPLSPQAYLFNYTEESEGGLFSPVFNLASTPDALGPEIPGGHLGLHVPLLTTHLAL